MRYWHCDWPREVPELRNLLEVKTDSTNMFPELFGDLAAEEETLRGLSSSIT